MNLGSQRSTLAAALLACAAGMSACSLVVAPENTEILCEYDPAFPPDPCPTGFECTDGRCLERLVTPPPPDGCVPLVEVCNGEDDNCNGIIDDGVDADGDGYTFCGTQRAPDGSFIAGPLMPAFADCADDDPNTHPNAPERCDGIDNDCASATPADVDSEVCVGGFLCDARTRTCVNPMDCTTVFTCGPGSVCNPTTRACTTVDCVPPCTGNTRCEIDSAGTTATCVAPSPDGEGCNVDSECASGACFDLAQLGATGGSATRGVCSRACCAKADCVSASDDCFAAPSGARACLPTDVPGTLHLAMRANASCSSVASMCSFSYQPTGWCQDDTGSICYFAGVAACVWGIAPDLCGSPCETGPVCGGNDTRCGFVLSNDTVAGVCYGSTTRTYAGIGGSCSTGADCRDGVCIAGTCAKPCCTDADCDGDVGKCLPSPGTFALMRCQSAAPAPL